MKSQVMVALLVLASVAAGSAGAVRPKRGLFPYRVRTVHHSLPYAVPHPVVVPVHRAVPVKVIEHVRVAVPRAVPVIVHKPVEVEVPRAVPVAVPRAVPFEVQNHVPVEVPRAVPVPFYTKPLAFSTHHITEAFAHTAHGIKAL